MPDTESDFPPLVLTFAASDPSGGAGMQADILTLASMGCHPLSVVTAITVQDTLGVEGVQPIDAEWVADQARCLLEDMPVDAFKIGVLGSVENIAAIAEIVSDYPDVPLILDPVLASGRGDELASDEMTHALRELLLPQTTILTPNSIEARRLAESDDDDEPDARALRRRMLIETGCEFVLVTGTHENTPQVVNTLYGKSGVVRSDTWQRLPGSYHGSGCTLASAIAAMLANGLDLPEAVREAQEYTWQALRKAYRPGMGQFLPDRLFWAREERRARRRAGPTAPGGCPRQPLTAPRCARASRGCTPSPRTPRTPRRCARRSPRRSPAARASCSTATRRRRLRCAPRRPRALARVCARGGALSSSTTTPRSRAGRRRRRAPGRGRRRSRRGARARRRRAADRRLLLRRRSRAPVRCAAAGADYVAFGSFFPSPVKPGARRAPTATARARARARRAGGRHRRHHGGQCALRSPPPAPTRVAVITAVFAPREPAAIAAAAPRHRRLPSIHSEPLRP